MLSEAVRVLTNRALAPPDGFEHSPLAVVTAGYDSDVTEAFLWSRKLRDAGFNLIIYDGPGQGRVNTLDGVGLRHDWEVVLSSLLDHALDENLGGFKQQHGVVSYGLSLGGHLTCRAALFEHRPTVYVVDPAHPTLKESVYEKTGPLADFYQKQSMAASPMSFEELPPAIVKAIQFIQSPAAAAKGGGLLKQRAFKHLTRDALSQTSWPHEYMREVAKFHTELSDYAGVQVPFIMCTQEGDPLISNKRGDALKVALAQSPAAADSTTITFTAAEGAEDHMALGCRTHFWERTLDVLLPLLKQKL